MRFAVWLLLFSCCAAPSVRAGAWLREAGEGFAAASATLRGGTGTDEMSLYADYGLQPRLTVGLDVNRRGYRSGHAVVFLRAPLFQGPHGGRLAVQAGLGAHEAGSASGAMGKIALLYGRPLGRDDAGWFGLQAAAEHRAGLQAPVYKLDAVAGLPVDGPVQPMLQLETFHTDGYGFGWTVTPALIFGPRGRRRWIAGLQYREGGGTHSMGLTIGLWQRF